MTYKGIPYGVQVRAPDGVLARAQKQLQERRQQSGAQ